MKYAILGFNQERVIEYDIDLIDLVILDYIIRANGNPTLPHTIDSEISFVWIKHSQLSQDLPILKISEGTLKNRLTRLKKEGFIQTIIIANKSGQGSMSYYSITEKSLSLVNSENEKTRSLKNDLVERPGHLKMTSNNIDIDNNISNICNNTINSITPNIEPSEFESHSYSSADMKEEFLGSVKHKPKIHRKSLYEKCKDEIYRYTKDLALQNSLVRYLSVRLAIREKPIYGVGQWKGLLNRLDKMSGDKIQIVDQSTERGWCSFYEIKTANREDSAAFGPESNRVKSVPSETTTEERQEILKKQGKRSVF